jgi:hypothetical protein
MGCSGHDPKRQHTDTCSFPERHGTAPVRSDDRGQAETLAEGFYTRPYCFAARFPMAQSEPAVRMKICPSDTAGELSV